MYYSTMVLYAFRIRVVHHEVGSHRKRRGISAAFLCAVDSTRTSIMIVVEYIGRSAKHVLTVIQLPGRGGAGSRVSSVEIIRA